MYYVTCNLLKTFLKQFYQAKLFAYENKLKPSNKLNIIYDSLHIQDTLILSTSINCKIFTLFSPNRKSL